jgi:hypothetical protein
MDKQEIEKGGKREKKSGSIQRYEEQRIYTEQNKFSNFKYDQYYQI